jgi:hypothetical protein
MAALPRGDVAPGRTSVPRSWACVHGCAAFTDTRVFTTCCVHGRAGPRGDVATAPMKAARPCALRVLNAAHAEGSTAALPRRCDTAAAMARRRRTVPETLMSRQRPMSRHGRCPPAAMSRQRPTAPDRRCVSGDVATSPRRVAAALGVSQCRRDTPRATAAVSVSQSLACLSPWLVAALGVSQPLACCSPWRPRATTALGVSQRWRRAWMHRAHGRARAACMGLRDHAPITRRPRGNHAAIMRQSRGVCR